MSKKKIIGVVLCLQVLTLLLSIGISVFLFHHGSVGEREPSLNVIRGTIVFVGAPIQDSKMEDAFIVYIQESSGSDLLTTILITPDTWLFDGHGGVIWEQCLRSKTEINDYLNTGVEIEAWVYPPDSSICDRHVLLYPARTAEIQS